MTRCDLRLHRAPARSQKGRDRVNHLGTAAVLEAARATLEPFVACGAIERLGPA